jgi:hypothetical protein
VGDQFPLLIADGPPAFSQLPRMLASYFAAIVDFCIRRAPLIIAVTAILGLGSAAYVERHFAVNSNLKVPLLQPMSRKRAGPSTDREPAHRDHRS